MPRYGNYGRRGGGGQRGGGRGWGRGGWNDGSDSGQGVQGSRGGAGGGSRRPPHLRGRDIGMFYAGRSQAMKKKLDVEMRPRIQIREAVRRDIGELLNEYCIKHALHVGQIPPTAADTEDRDIEMKGEDSEGASLERSESSSSSLHLAGSEADFGEISVKTEQPMPSSSSTMASIKTETAQGTGIDNVMQQFKHEEDFMLEEVISDHFVPNDDNVSEFPLATMVYDETIENQLKQQWVATSTSQAYENMLINRKRLPTLQMARHISDMIDKNPVVVISGETGCGKSTQVPQIILDNALNKGTASKTYIVVTQPRRISATSLAYRVAQERNETLSRSVGYQIRLDVRKPRDRGSILYCTNGILLRWLLSDKCLLAVSHLVLDEIHERDLFSDFLLIIIKDILKVRRDIKVVLMSATLNAEHFSEYFNNCPMIEIPGRQFPVQNFFLEDVLRMTNYSLPEDKMRRRNWCPEEFMHLPRYEKREAQRNYLIEYQKDIDSLVELYPQNVIRTLREWNEDKIDFDLVVQLVLYIVKTYPNSEEAILIFLPGWQDMKNLLKTFQNSGNGFNFASLYSFVPVHSLLPSVDQNKVFNRPNPGCRKVVLATNIAETSITIEDVVHVIDCGKIKMSNFDPQCNLLTLRAEWVSQANAKQRRGRAGRMRDGFCYHLFRGSKFPTLQSYMAPEMQRTRLESLCLQIKLMGFGTVKEFVAKAPDPPLDESLSCALNGLVSLGAIKSHDDDTLTALGYHLARMPAEPHCAKMMIMGAIFSCLDPALTVACSLDYKDPFHVPFGLENLLDEIKREKGGHFKSDHLFWISLYKEYLETVKNRGPHAGRAYAREHYLNETTMRLVQKMKTQFCDHLLQAGFVSTSDAYNTVSNVNSEDVNLVRVIIGSALYPGICESIPKKNLNSRVPLKFDSGGRWSKRVEIHPKSSTAVLKEVESRYVCYHQAVRSSKIYMNDCSMVSPLNLVLFARPITFSGKLLEINSWIQFYCDEECAQFLFKTNEIVHDLLMKLYENPVVVQWNRGHETEFEILRAVKYLIDEEQIGVNERGSDRNGDDYKTERRGFERDRRDDPWYRRHKPRGGYV